MGDKDLESRTISLLKTNARGSTQLWKATVDANVATYEWGQKGGAMQKKSDVYDVGKQKRSAPEQAWFEVLSVAKKKKRAGYVGFVPGEEETTTAAVAGSSEQRESAQVLAPLPMLAQEFKKRVAAKKVCDSVYVQPKLDGIRCLAYGPTGELWSRKRKRIEGLAHIEQAVRDLHYDGWLDGELYKHGVSFQKITSMVRNLNIASNLLNVEYHVYDAVLELPFRDRYDTISKLLVNTGSTLEYPIKLVNTVKTSMKDTKSFDEVVASVSGGYEGAIVRQDDKTPYEKDKRSYSLLKKKDFEQSEFKVVDFCKEELADRLGSVELEMSDGQRFRARPAMSVSERDEIWNNKEHYRNMTATVKYFELSDGGIPRFPVLIGFRHSDDM